MNRRAVAVAVGLIAVAAGFALTLWPDLAPSADVATLFVVVAWGIAIVGAAAAAVDRIGGDADAHTTLPSASDRPAYDVPGDRLAAELADVSLAERDAADRDRVRERLRSTAVAAVVRAEDVDPETARERLRDGTWTDDESAAALFAADAEGRTPGGVEAAFRQRVERAASELASRIESTGGERA